MLAYSQSAERQGVDAALNEVAISQSDPRFAEARAISTKVNLAAKSRMIGRVQVKIASGHVRLELPGNEADSAKLSPICIFVPIAEIRSIEKSVVAAVQTVAATGRSVNPVEVRAGFKAAVLTAENIRRRKLVTFAVAAAALAVVEIIIQLMGAQASGN